MERDDEVHVPAFRAAEKKYQLRRDGRRRSGRGRERQVADTDLSEAVVLPCEKGGAAHASDSRIVGLGDGPGRTAAYSLQGHPGLYIFPGALPIQQQLELIRQAWENWPEPPASTNLTAHHGDLRGLWKAARQHLSLKTSAQAVVPEAGSVPQGAETPEQHIPRTPHAGKNGNHCCCSCRALSRWTTANEGPTAEQLLKKLRWVSLGPHYNWGERTYDIKGSHQELPEQLKQIGWQFAQQVADIEILQNGDRGSFDTAGCSQGSSQAERDCSHRFASTSFVKKREACRIVTRNVVNGNVHEAGQTGTLPMYSGSLSAVQSNIPRSSEHLNGATVSLLGTRQQVSPDPCQFHPDAALVNYYPVGSTLGGHKDDVESDLTQPIVSVSLGCPAVFLIGGSSKETVPTAVVLNSGDVVVMSGPARACYHGVPRVLSERGLPQALRDAKDKGDYTPYVAALEGMRINVSIRMVGA